MTVISLGSFPTDHAKEDQEMTHERPRLFYIDNLRILLIVLVVLHHLAITYGAPGDWPYREGQPDMVAPVAVVLCFLLSNYIRKLPLAKSIL